jgi:hypothetical protein
MARMKEVQRTLSIPTPALLVTSMAEVLFSGHTVIKDGVGGAAASFQGNVHVTFNGTTKFMNNNIVSWGLGALQVSDNIASIMIIGKSYFEGNRGGAIALKADPGPLGTPH